MLRWQVAAALARLQPEHRELIRLAHWSGLTLREIAELKGIPLGTVKSRTSYALRNLRLVLDEMGVEASGCPTHADLMGGYVLGALQPAEHEEMERHLQTCELCRREHAWLTGLPALLDRIEPADVPPPVPSASLEDAVLDRVARERGRRHRTLTRLRPRTVALVAAAVAVLAVALATVLLTVPEDDSAYAFGKLRGTPGAGGSRRGRGPGRLTGEPRGDRPPAPS